MLQEVSSQGGDAWTRRHVLGIAASAAAWSVWANAQPNTSGAKPIAFLIGNTEYRPKNRSILTAHKNVRNLEDVLTELGYDTTAIFNASKRAILSHLDETLAKAPRNTPFFMYFCGHGINSYSKGEYRNYWLATDLQVIPPTAASTDSEAKRQHFEQLALASPSLEEDIYPRFVNARGGGQSFIMVDACREISGLASDIDATMVQSRPPTGCLVGYATSPGKFALTPDDADRNSYFAESLIEQLKAVQSRTNDDGDMTQILQRVRIQVRERVNAIAKAENALDYLLGLTGQKTGYIQEPTYASSISNKALLRPQGTLVAIARPPQPVTALPPKPAPVAATTTIPIPVTAIPEPVAPPVQMPIAVPVAGVDSLAWTQIETLSDPEAAELALQNFIAAYPASQFKDNAKARLEDVQRVREAVRKTRLFRVPLVLTADNVLQSDYRAALQGDKFAAQRMAEAISKNPSMGDAAVAQRWLQFAAELGNGIAAYAAFQKFNSQNLIQEASYYLTLAQNNGYRIPRDFDTRK